MLVVMQAHATEEQIRAVCQKIEVMGYRPHAMPGATRTAIGVTGNQGEVEQGTLGEMPGVQEVIRVSNLTNWSAATSRKRTRSCVLPGRMRPSAGRIWP